MTELKIDTGDIVLHTPTDEKWTVACVQGSELSWCGWPEGRAALADCTLVEKATPEVRDSLLTELANMKAGDHRQRYASARLAFGATSGEAQ